MSPGDIIFFDDGRFGVHRFYLVEGCHYGAVGHTSLIELRSLTERPGSLHGREAPATCLVPEPLLRGHKLYRKSTEAA